MKKQIKRFFSSDVIQAITALFSSNVLFAVVGILVSLIQGRFMSAEDLGYWGQFGIISSYIFFLQFGIFHAAERLIPYYYGSDKKEKAEEVVQVGQAWMLIICIPIMIVYFVFSFQSFAMGNWKAGLGYLAQIFVVFTQLYSGFIKSTFRSGKDFKSLAQGQMCIPIMYILCLPLYLVQPYVALFFRTISTIVSDIVIFRKRPFKTPPKVNAKIWRKLVAQGFPLFFAYYIATTGVYALQSTLILKYLGYKNLGYWSFSYTVFTYAKNLPNAISAVYTPRIIQKYGETHDLKKCVESTKKPIKLGILISLLIVLAGSIAVQKVMPLVLPNYAETKNLICILLFGLPLYTVSYFETVLTAANKMVAKLFCALGNSGLQILSAVIFCNKGFGIYGFALGTIAGYLFELIIIILYTKWCVNKGERP